ASTHTLTASSGFTRAATSITTNDPAGIVSFTDEREAMRSFITLLAWQRALRANNVPNDAAFRRALDERAYSVSETRPVEGGFEKRTRSAFGQFGTLARQLAGG